MSRRAVEDEEIPVPYKWKIDEKLIVAVLASLTLTQNDNSEKWWVGDKSTYQYWRQEAYNYYDEGKFSEAIKSFDKSLEIKPNVDACLGKARVFEELGTYDQAVRCYDDYLEKHADNDYQVQLVCLYKGSLLRKLDRYIEAIHSYDKCVKLKPPILSLLLEMVGIFGQIGKYSEVIKWSDKIIRSDDDDRWAIGWLFKAIALDALGGGDLKAAIERNAIQSYDKRVKLRGLFLWPLLEMVGLLGQIGKYSEVIKWSDKIIRSDDDDAKIGAWFFKANAFDALGEFDKAIKYYDKVIRQLASALYYRGRSKVKNGDIMGGLSDLKAAVERNDMYRKLASSDKDFESIRNDAVFRSLVTKP
jgi:tetratricopeptide (TPR) repeat protein